MYTTDVKNVFYQQGDKSNLGNDELPVFYSIMGISKLPGYLVSLPFSLNL